MAQFIASLQVSVNRFRYQKSFVKGTPWRGAFCKRDTYNWPLLCAAAILKGMTPAAFRLIDRNTRRQAIRLAYLNGGLWAIGNGLTSTSLIIYLALELGAKGLVVSAIIAAPRLLGLSRLFTPKLLDRIGSRKKFCVATYALSSVLLLLLPVFAAPGVLPTKSLSLSALVALWGGYQLLEYFATIALWSWLRDLTPAQVRGRFLGHRDRFLTLGRVVGMLASGGFTYHWINSGPEAPKWLGYALPAGVGAIVMLLSVLPLARMAEARNRRSINDTNSTSFRAAFQNQALLRLAAYGVVLSLINGLTQAAQGMYPYRVLGLDFLWLMGFRSMMYLGQSASGPSAGWLADRFGNRPVLIVSQVIVASGPLFFYLASAEQVWILGLAFLAWIAYAGINVAQPALLLKLGPSRDAATEISIYYAFSGLAFGIGSLVGGAALDQLIAAQWFWKFGGAIFDVYDSFFLFGTIARLFSVVLLIRLIEPDAQRLRDLLSGATTRSRS